MKPQENQSSITLPESQTSYPASPSGRLRKLFSILAKVAAGTMFTAGTMAVAGASAGCSNLPEAENVAKLEAENKRLTDDLEGCRELKDMREGIFSEGTLGLRRLYSKMENRFRITKESASIDQIFVLWPSPQVAEGITIEGDDKKLSIIKIGSYFGVQFKAEYKPGEVSKDAFVIQNGFVGNNTDPDMVSRYTIIIEHR